MADIRDIPGYIQTPPVNQKKAKVFFDHARTVAAAGQFDYAISMYIDGLNQDPEAIAEHQQLRDVSLQRKASGGKPLGMLAAMPFKKGGKDEKTNMLNNERLLAHDPGNLDYMLGVVQNAAKGGYFETVQWMGPILQRANQDSQKEDLGKYLALKDVYKSVQQWKQAADAAVLALELKPGDMDLQTEVKHLAAQQSMVDGRYGQGGDFRQSIRNSDEQERLMEQDRDVRTLDAMTRQIEAAKAEYEAAPGEPGKIRKYAEVLVKTGDPNYENEAIEVLEKAHKATGQFTFRREVGRINMNQLGRMEKSLRAQVNQNPGDAELRKDYEQFRKEQLEAEHKEYALAAAAYPTDVSLKYEMAKRLFELKRYGEAIPLFQQAVQDPKFRVEASVSLGRAFLEAEFADEAVDTLKGLVDGYEGSGDTKGKEIYYWYARSLEEKQEMPDAIKSYSKVAQWDFTYRDVQDRIKRLRAAASAAAK